MSSFDQLIHAGAAGDPSPDSGRNSGPSSTSQVVFGGLVDLMRTTARNAQGREVCDECKMLNRRGACYCKGCLHKLPAYFTSANPRAPFVIWRRREQEVNRTSALDLVAVCVVLFALVLMTANIPIGQ